LKVDFALFSGDELKHRGILQIDKERAQVNFDGFLKFEHELLDDHALIVLEIYEQSILGFAGNRLLKSTLNMPIHLSGDWETIELTEFTFAFRCM
jgi:hypothetical protein